MNIKKILVICVMAVTINIISLMSIVCVEADSQGSVSAPQGSNPVYSDISKEDLLKIYHRGDIRKYESKDNEEVFVFDDILTPGSDDTITFYLVDGKVKAWDKNKVIFPTDEGLIAVIHPNISKEDLLKVYPIGNLKAYARDGNKEVGTFYDISTPDSDDTVTFYLVDGKVKSWKRSKLILPTREELHKIFPIEKRKAYARSGNTEGETFYNILTSDPDDTITFYLVDGKVSSWDINTEASVANARLIDETMADVRLKVKSDADARLEEARSESGARLKAESEAGARLRAKSEETDAILKAQAESDFKEMVANAKSNVDARINAMEERSRYDNYSQNYSTDEDDIMKAKQQSRSASMRGRGWGYNGGLYYR